MIAIYYFSTLAAGLGFVFWGKGILPNRLVYFFAQLVVMYSAFYIFYVPQKQFREITQRHLDFYYKEVLKLQEKPAVPDKVHVTFGLAQNVDTQLLRKGTLLSAGKDSLGRDLHYAIDEDIVQNQPKQDDHYTN